LSVRLFFFFFLPLFFFLYSLLAVPFGAKVIHPRTTLPVMKTAHPFSSGRLHTAAPGTKIGSPASLSQDGSQAGRPEPAVSGWGALGVGATWMSRPSRDLPPSTTWPSLASLGVGLYVTVQQHLQYGTDGRGGDGAGQPTVPDDAGTGRYDTALVLSAAQYRVLAWLAALAKDWSRSPAHAPLP